jgi:hypothetical protein
MVEVTFDIQVVDEDDALPEAERFLDNYELDMMLEHTRSQLNTHIQRALAGMRCAEHDQPPAVRVEGEYHLDTEQLEVNYHVETCCKPFLMQTVMALNQR